MLPWTLVLNCPISFGPRSAHCSSALCLFATSLVGRLVVFPFIAIYSSLANWLGIREWRHSHDITVWHWAKSGNWMLDRSLMIDWRKNSWNPERVTSVFTFVSVCVSATEHTFWHRNLIFGSSDPWDMRKKTHFFVFRNFHFYAFYWHFSIFSLYNTSNFLFSSYRS